MSLNSHSVGQKRISKRVTDTVSKKIDTDKKFIIDIHKIKD